MRRLLLSALLALAFAPPMGVLAPSVAHAATPSADELLSKIDGNMTFDTRSAKLQMTVTKGTRVKVYEMQSFGRGADEGAVEYLAPARDKGTRMLKKGGELWMYLPSIEKTQRISGHMLRQSMMGSDFSYEDMLESADLRTRYDAVVAGEEEIDGRRCYKLEMTAKQPEVTYPKRVSWVDAEHLVPVREELYAVSGMLLKVFTFSDVKDFGGRKFPTRFTAEDQLQKGSTTEMVWLELSFSVPLEEEVFSQRWLER